MKILAVVQSTHQGNTHKLAEAMAEVAPMTITDVEHAAEYHFHDYDIVGFGSGIYYGSHDKKLIELAGSLCDKPAYTFVFSTSGQGMDKYNKPLADLLTSKNKTVLGSFACKGLDQYFIFKLVGGINKGHPNHQDLANAQSWIADIVKKYEQQNQKQRQ